MKTNQTKTEKARKEITAEDFKELYEGCQTLGDVSELLKAVDTDTLIKLEEALNLTKEWLDISAKDNVLRVSIKYEIQDRARKSDRAGN